MQTEEQPQVVIIGAGFGGLEAAKVLGRAPVRQLILDRTNYHLFQPLLYQVATAALSPADIAAPIRGVISKFPNVDVMLTEARSIDVAARTVSTDRPRDSLRLPDRRHWLAAFLFRERTMGAPRPGLEEPRRCGRN